MLSILCCKDKTKEEITKDEHSFLRTLTTQLANKGLTAQKAIPSLGEDKKQSNDFGRFVLWVDINSTWNFNKYIIY